MASLVVGGVTIPVAVSSPSWNRIEAVDRRRAFDGTYRTSETGGATRDWTFSTTPVTQADADTYIAALSSPAAKLCSGDILQIPTMCSPELPSGKPTRAASSNRVVLDFMLHEIQPAKVLLKHAPGDTITGESFSRSAIGYYLTGNVFPNPLSWAGINVKRDSHYIGGIRSTLLEDARTNSLLWSNDFNNAAWVKTTCTVGTGIADPVGGTSACTLTATGTDASAQQTLATGASIVRTNSLWMRRRTGTGAVHLYEPNPGSGNRITPTLTEFWQRVSLANSAASINRSLLLILAVSGDAIDVWCGQLEDGAFMSSEIPTTTVAVTRGADSYSLPFTTPPQEMTVYAKFVEGGTTLENSARLFEISSAADANPRFLVYAPSGQFSAFHGTATDSATSDLAAQPALRDTAEIVARLFGDGSVDIVQSINGVASTIGAQTVAITMATAWSGQLLWLNSAGTTGGEGFTAFQSFKIVAGSRSLAEMRTL